MASSNPSDFGRRFEQSLVELKRIPTLRAIRGLMLFICYTFIAICMFYIYTGGWKSAPLTLALITLFLAALCGFIDNYIVKIYLRATKVIAALEAAEMNSVVRNKTEGQLKVTAR